MGPHPWDPTHGSPPALGHLLSPSSRKHALHASVGPRAVTGALLTRLPPRPPHDPRLRGAPFSSQERRLKEETERKASFQMEQVEIGSVGFMPLKKLLQERGVPKEQVFACANKFALIEVAKKWGPELKIEFIA